MKRKKLYLTWLLAASLALVGCSGGGGGGGIPADPVDPTDPTDPTDPPVPPVGPVEGTVYQFFDLGDADPAGTFTAAIAINSSQTVVGVSDAGGIKAARWALPNLSPAVLNPLTGGNYSAAYGINETNVTVGEAENDAGEIVAVYWTTGTNPISLNRGAFDTADSAAYSINNNGVVVGEVIDAQGNSRAILWPGLDQDPTALADLGMNGASAYFINDNGVIAGEAINAGGNFQAVVWMPVNGVYGAPTLLSGLLNQVASAAFGVDMAGNIVGEAELATGVVHGVVWNTTGAVVADIGASTSAQAVSQGIGSDLIVGYVDALSGADRAAVWNRRNLADNQMVGPFSQAYGVNDLSDLVGVRNNKALAGIAQ